MGDRYLFAVIAVMYNKYTAGITNELCVNSLGNPDMEWELVELSDAE